MTDTPMCNLIGCAKSYQPDSQASQAAHLYCCSASHMYFLSPFYLTPRPSLLHLYSLYPPELSYYPSSEYDEVSDVTKVRNFPPYTTQTLDMEESMNLLSTPHPHPLSSLE